MSDKTQTQIVSLLRTKQVGSKVTLVVRRPANPVPGIACGGGLSQCPDCAQSARNTMRPSAGDRFAAVQHPHAGSRMGSHSLRRPPTQLAADGEKGFAVASKTATTMSTTNPPYFTLSPRSSAMLNRKQFRCQSPTLPSETIQIPSGAFTSPNGIEYPVSSPPPSTFVAMSQGSWIIISINQ